jgi:hypothetical protein
MISCLNLDRNLQNQKIVWGSWKIRYVHKRRDIRREAQTLHINPSQISGRLLSYKGIEHIPSNTEKMKKTSQKFQLLPTMR